MALGDSEAVAPYYPETLPLIEADGAMVLCPGEEPDATLACCLHQFYVEIEKGFAQAGAVEGFEQVNALEFGNGQQGDGRVGCVQHNFGEADCGVSGVEEMIDVGCILKFLAELVYTVGAADIVFDIGGDGTVAVGFPEGI